MGPPQIIFRIDVEKGNQLVVNGAELRYRVAEKFTVAATDLSVVYPTDTPRLTLITCDIPSWNPANNSYDDRLVVIAVPA